MRGTPQNLEGQVVLITGGGSGIGKATAIMMGLQGARVAVTELPGRTNLAEAVVSEIQNLGQEATALTLDVTASLTIDAVVDKVAETFGGLDVLVNNAGVQILKPALDLEEAEFEQVLAVNLKGAFLCAQAAARLMIEGGGGNIINVASQHGVVGNRLRAPYCVSKGGLISLTQALAVEWAPYGIRVNAISPTFVRTEANASLFDSDDMKFQIAHGVLVGRPASPEDVAAGIVFLASPAARMVTGHNLLVDGGWTAH